MPLIRVDCCALALFILVPALASAQAPGAGRAGVALGAPAPVVANPLLQALDVDGDGTISAKEIRAAVKALKKMDVNGDGKLTPDELVPRVHGAAGGAGPAGAGGPAGAAHGAAAVRRGGFGAAGGFGGPGGAVGGFGGVGGVNNGGGLGGGGIRAGGGRGLPMNNRQMLGFDKNRDGTVSRQEVPAQLWAIYGRYDVNRDGKLDPVELARASKAGR